MNSAYRGRHGHLHAALGRRCARPKQDTGKDNKPDAGNHEFTLSEKTRLTENEPFTVHCQFAPNDMDANNHSPATILDNPGKKTMSANQTVVVIWEKKILEKENGSPNISYAIVFIYIQKRLEFLTICS
jgi:hypothetical protein